VDRINPTNVFYLFIKPSCNVVNELLRT
jgi:hypothetical protein